MIGKSRWVSLRVVLAIVGGIGARDVSTAQQAAPASTLCRPALTAPAAGAVLTQRRLPDNKFSTVWSFSWTTCPGADRYHLFVIGPGAQNPIVNVATLDKTSYTERSTHYGIERLEGWSWKVRARFGRLWGDWSEVRTFNVNSKAEAAPPGVCSISGRVGNDKPAYQTRIELLEAPAKTRIRSVRVNARGEYRFENVPEGTYLIVPKGNYPGDEWGGLTPEPHSEDLVCYPNKNYHKNFNIRRWAEG
jgi:hypothetical protein